jgi:hypothetical protein
MFRLKPRWCAEVLRLSSIDTRTASTLKAMIWHVMAITKIHFANFGSLTISAAISRLVSSFCV